MAGIVHELFQAYIALNYQQTGMSECYSLRAATWADARAAALQIATVRSWLLGEGAWVEWVDVRQPLYPAPVWPCLQDPIQALKNSNGSPYWTPPDNAGTGLNVIWNPRGHKKYWRRLWYIPDEEVFDSEWVRKGLSVPKATPPLPNKAFLVQKDLLWQHVIGTIRDLTCLAVRIDDLPNGQPQWQTYDFQGVTFGAVRGSRPRPRWFRVTWEWADWTHAAHFSPCGCPVNVRRETYEVEAVPYQGGSDNQIRFLYAQAGAKILPWKTIFSSHYGLQDYVRAAGVGEFSGAPVVDWTYGLGWGAPPGLQPTGGPNAFLGLAFAPFDDTQPTPPNFRPGCDMPAPLPITVDDNPGAVTVLDVTHLSFHEDDFIVTEVSAGWARVQAVDRDPLDRRDHNAWRAMSSEATMAGRWYTTWETGTQYYHSPIGLPTGYAVATPVFPGSGGTVLGIAFQVTSVTTPGKKTRVALYQAIDADTPSPGLLLYDSGDIDVSSLGLKEVNCSVELRRDTLYFLVLVSNATQTEVIYEGVDTTFMFPTWGRDKDDLTLFAGAKLQKAYPFGALIDQASEWPPADGPGAYNLTTPVVAVRFTGALAHGREAGGLALGGDADIAWAISFDATGGISFGGDATVGTLVDEDATGGLSFGGDAEAFNTLLEDLAGGLELGGDAEVFNVTVIDATGGLSFGGDAEVAALQFADATGGLSFGGDAEIEIVVSVEATGGLEFGGNPDTYYTWIEDLTGGLQFGGAADYDYDPGVLFQLLLPSTIGSSGWTNPDNMKTDDGANGTWGPMSMLMGHTGSTDYTNFGFTIPGTVDGVEVIVKMREDGAAIKLDFVNLINLGSTFGDNKGTSTELSTSMGETTFGGPADMWGAVGILTAATVNGSAFGVRLNWAWISGTPTVIVDWVKIKVYYH